jgi:hypothetical protein
MEAVFFFACAKKYKRTARFPVQAPEMRPNLLWLEAGQ